MNNLKITIEGSSNSGKSTISFLIQQVLLSAGYTVEMNLDDEVIDYGSIERFEDEMKQNLEIIKEISKETKVDIIKKLNYNGK